MSSQKTETEYLQDKDQAWQSFVEGDQSSFERVFKCYFKPMYGYGIKICDAPQLVKDCIQELFHDLWKRRESLGHIESPNVYLYVSLRRKIIKEVSSRQAEGDLKEIDEYAHIQFAKQDIIIKDEVKFQKKQELAEALNQLSNRQKEVVILHFYNGMSYGEIEEILSINRQSVRNHMYRAMETLRSLLDTEIMKLVVSFLLAILCV